jgi:hypothetical protein
MMDEWHVLTARKALGAKRCTIQHHSMLHEDASKMALESSNFAVQMHTTLCKARNAREAPQSGTKAAALCH